jgi:hypothetical protein
MLPRSVKAPAVTAEPTWYQSARFRMFGVRVSYAGAEPPLREFSAYAVNDEPGDRSESWLGPHVPGGEARLLPRELPGFTLTSRPVVYYLQPYFNGWFEAVLRSPADCRVSLRAGGKEFARMGGESIALFVGAGGPPPVVTAAEFASRLSAAR